VLPDSLTRGDVGLIAFAYSVPGLAGRPLIYVILWRLGYEGRKKISDLIPDDTYQSFWIQTTLDSLCSIVECFCEFEYAMVSKGGVSYALDPTCHMCSVIGR
jgi:hypothetical protein